MPFLRFTRDKRGYETTALIHAFRGRQGRTRQKLLYWFRTPPSVKVGRPALDEEAIRWIEEHNPDIDFDWQKILASTPPAAPAEDGKDRRDRRGRAERARQGGQRPASPRQAQPAAPTAGPEMPVAATGEEEREIRTTGDLNLPEALDQQFAEGEEEVPEAQALEQVTHPETEELPAGTRAPVETIVPKEQLIRLRARYAELQARITERGGEAARIEELREQAGRLNPDSWVTAADTVRGLEEFDAKIRDLRAALGLRRRRRSRRGGRRHRGKLADRPSQATASDSASNPPGESPKSGEPG